MRHAYQHPINLPDISAQANLSPYHFLRVHKLAYGETPHEFLTRLRIDRAKTLLARGSHNVTEACFEVGFSSLGSFSALFNQRVGLSPSDTGVMSGRASRSHERSVLCSSPRASSPCSAGLPKRDESNFREANRIPSMLSSRRSHDTGRSAVIKRQSHSTIFVTDQQEALEFYRDKLGFEVRTDMPMTDEGDIRWLTLSPKGQPDLEMILAPLTPGPMFDAKQAEQIKVLVQSGALGIGVFETDDINSDYERLSTQGVEFVSPPEEKFYGIEAIVKDNSGNWFSLTQRKG